MKSWRILLGCLISLAFLYFAFRGQHLGDIRDAFQETNLWWVPVALLLYFAGVYVRAIRWKLLLRPVGADLSARQLFPIVVVGYMANNVIPLRAGELVRPVLLRRKYGVRRTAALATIAIERIFDGLAMLAFLAFSMVFVSLTSQLRHLAIIAFLIFVGLLAGMFLLTFAGDLIQRLLQLALGPLPSPVTSRVERMLESFLGGLGIFRTRSELVKVAGTSLLAWLFEASMYFVLAYAFGGAVRDAMSGSVTLLTTSVANLSTLIPGAPGYIGQFEYGVSLVLHGARDVPEAQALAFALLVHATLYFPITLLGAVEWFRQEMTMGQLADADDDERVGASSPAA